MVLQNIIWSDVDHENALDVRWMIRDACRRSPGVMWIMIGDAEDHQK